MKGSKWVKNGYHGWIHVNRKHYDAEGINGVKNFYDLSIFKRMPLLSFEQYINESRLFENKDDNKTVILLDGTSSSGKSFTLDSIGAKHFYEKPAKGDYEIIAIDDFVDDGEMNDAKSKHNQRRWKLEKEAGLSDEVTEWAKNTGNYGCCVKDFLGIMKQSTKDREDTLKKLIDENGSKEEIEDEKKNIEDNKKFIKEMPKAKDHSDFKPGTDPRAWYMYQQYKKSKSKKIIFDDVQPTIVDYIPKIDAVILLHAPISVLIENLRKREDTDPRNPLYVLEDYLVKYEVTKVNPSAKEGDPNRVITKTELTNLLKGATKAKGFSLSEVDDKYIKEYPAKLGIKGEGKYYIKVKDEYLKKYKPTIVNVDDARKDYVDQFRDIILRK